MFTVMHESIDGRQEVFSAISIGYYPMTEANGDCGGVHLYAGPGEAGPGIRVGTIRDGRVFVMNDKGATVARYDLVRRPPPPVDCTHGR